MVRLLHARLGRPGRLRRRSLRRGGLPAAARGRRLGRRRHGRLVGFSLRALPRGVLWARARSRRDCGRVALSLRRPRHRHHGGAPV